MDDADHRVCRPAGRRPRPRGLAREGQDHAAQLDRPQPGRPGVLPGRGSGREHRGLHHAPRHALRCDLHGAGAGAPAAGLHCLARGLARCCQAVVDERRADPEGGRRGIPAAGLAQERGRAPDRGQGQDRRLHRRLRDQPGQRRAGPGLRRRLRPDGLRHRRHHGRAGAGPPRLGVRDEVRAADHPDGAAGRGPPGRRGLRRGGAGDQLGQRRDLPQRHGRRRGQGRHHRVAGRQGLRRGHHQLQAARLAVLAPALLGRAVPHRLRRGGQRPRGARVDAAGDAARRARLLAAHLRARRRRLQPRAAAVAGPGVGRGRARPG